MVQEALRHAVRVQSQLQREVGGMTGGNTPNAQRQQDAQRRAQELSGHILPLRAEGKSLRNIAAALTAAGIPTANGGTWGATQVLDILQRLEQPTVPEPEPKATPQRQREEGEVSMDLDFLFDDAPDLPADLSPDLAPVLAPDRTHDTAPDIPPDMACDQAADLPTQTHKPVAPVGMSLGSPSDTFKVQVTTVQNGYVVSVRGADGVCRAHYVCIEREHLERTLMGIASAIATDQAYPHNA